jgi:hypothetical protein
MIKPIFEIKRDEKIVILKIYYIKNENYGVTSWNVYNI